MFVFDSPLLILVTMTMSTIDGIVAAVLLKHLALWVAQAVSRAKICLRGSRFSPFFPIFDYSFSYFQLFTSGMIQSNIT